jgi:hypothetical protein
MGEGDQRRRARDGEVSADLARQVEPAEFSAGIDMLMREIEFANQSHDFLNVEGAAPSPDLQHVVLTPAFDGSQYPCIFLSELSATGQTPSKIPA